MAGPGVSAPLVAYLDAECNQRSVGWSLHPLSEVERAISSNRTTTRLASVGGGKFDVKARKVRH